MTQRETLLTCEETMSVQQRHKKLKVEEAVSQQSRVSSTEEGGFRMEEMRCCWKTWPLTTVLLGGIRNALKMGSSAGC